MKNKKEIRQYIKNLNDESFSGKCDPNQISANMCIISGLMWVLEDEND